MLTITSVYLVRLNRFPAVRCALGGAIEGDGKRGRKGNKRATKKEINNAKGEDSSRILFTAKVAGAFIAPPPPPNEKIAVSFDLSSVSSLSPLPSDPSVSDFVPASNDRVYVSTFSS